MARETTVNLASNGGYWQADWRDTTGRRRKKSLGSKLEVSERQARKLCQQLANELNKWPNLRVAGPIPQIKEWVDRYLDGRSDLSAGSKYLHRLTKRYLLSFFGEEA